MFDGNLKTMQNIFKISIIFILTGLPLLSEGQPFVLSETGTAIQIKGTSTLHDWTMDLRNFNSGFQIEQEGSLIKGIDNVTFSCKATDIKSESSLMDTKAYNALKAGNFPEIKFSSISTTGLASEGTRFTGNLNGKLSVAGETHDITVPFNGTFVDSRTINITATTDLTMSSFNITPPTAFLGVLKTGDKISVSFTLQFVQKTLSQNHIIDKQQNNNYIINNQSQ